MKQSELVSKTRKNISPQEVSLNAQLLERAGYVAKLMSGVYSYLPLGLRVLTKIENIVRDEMNALSAQEVLMPALQPRDPWDTTGRWNTVDVLYKLTGAGDRELCLGPTHEEIVTPLVKEYVQSYKDLPRAVYQIQTKFRNEARAKSGLLRGREFRMKDLYSFHTNSADLDTYYDTVITAYFSIFKRCGLGDITYLTYASGGIFSKYSHEFQALTPYGEDTVYLCKKCSLAINSEIIADQSTCIQCGSTELQPEKSIEVGNIFKLMTRFSEPFELNYADQAGKLHTVVMGCYGLGTSRLMGTIAEILHDGKGLCWPMQVAPFQVHLIDLTKTEEEAQKAQSLYAQLIAQGIEVLYDDRCDIHAGQKFAEADLLGMPLRIVISPKTLAQDAIELKLRTREHFELVPSGRLVELIKAATKGEKL